MLVQSKRTRPHQSRPAAQYLTPKAESRFFLSEDPWAKEQLEIALQYFYFDENLFLRKTAEQVSRNPTVLYYLFEGPISPQHFVELHGSFRPENLKLRKHYPSTLGVRGITKKGKKFKVQVKGKYLGLFSTLEEARRAVETVLDK